MIKRCLFLFFFLYFFQAHSANWQQFSDTLLDGDDESAQLLLETLPPEQLSCFLNTAIIMKASSITLDLSARGVSPCEHPEHSFDALHVFALLEELNPVQAIEFISGENRLYRAQNNINPLINEATEIQNARGFSFRQRVATTYLAHFMQDWPLSDTVETLFGANNNFYSREDTKPIVMLALTIKKPNGTYFIENLAKENLSNELAQVLRELFVYEDRNPYINIGSVFKKYGLWQALSSTIEHRDYKNLLSLLHALHTNDFSLNDDLLCKVLLKAAKTNHDEEKSIKYFSQYFPFKKYKKIWLEALRSSFTSFKKLPDHDQAMDVHSQKILFFVKLYFSNYEGNDHDMLLCKQRLEDPRYLLIYSQKCIEGLIDIISYQLILDEIKNSI